MPQKRRAGVEAEDMTDLELCAWVLLVYLPAAVVLSLVLMGTLG